MEMYLSLLVCIVGALAYGLSANPKISKMGEWAFVVGLLAFLMRFSPVVSALR